MKPGFDPVAARIRTEATDNWDDRVAVDRFEHAGGRFVRGRGRIGGMRTVTVGDETFTATRATLINIDTNPAVPPIPRTGRDTVLDNREAVATPSAPESLIVLGGGSVGTELAQAFARFGTRVDIVEVAGRLLPLEECSCDSPTSPPATSSATRTWRRNITPCPE